MTSKQKVNEFYRQNAALQAKRTYSIAQAAEEWIAMVEKSTKATPEAKAEMIGKIKAALPKVQAAHAENFVMATNEIKKAMVA